MWAFRREVYLCASRATSFLYFVCNPVQQTPENTRIKDEIQRAVDAVSVPEEIQTSRARTWKILIHDSGIQRKMEVFDDATPSEIADEIPSAAEIFLNSNEQGFEKNVVSNSFENQSLIKNLEFAAPVAHEQADRLLPANQIATDKGDSQPALEPASFVALPDSNASASGENTKQVIRLELPITPKKIADELGVKPFRVIHSLMKFKVFTSLGTSLMDVQLIKDVFQTYGAEFEPINPPKNNIAKLSAISVKNEMGPVDLKLLSIEAQVAAKLESVKSEESTQEDRRIPDANGYSDLQTDLHNFSSIKRLSSEGVAFKYSITIDGPESIREIAYKLGTPLKNVLEFAQQRGLQPYPSTVLDVRSIQVIAAKNGLGVKIAQDIARL
jgi:hypothetical protein